MVKLAGLKRFAWISIAAAVLTIALKTTAFLITGSVGLLSDALESAVNLVTAFFALAVLSVAEQPPDEQHAYGHAKAEYFAGGVEGTLILAAAITIAVSAIGRLLAPEPLEQVGAGLLLSAVAAALNLIVARVLLRAGQQYRSLTLRAEADHLMTDVWTTAGVLLGVAAVALTGWQPLDSIIALAVAGQIVFSGIKLIRGAVRGLMDSSLPTDELERIGEILSRHAKEGVQFHALRTRQSGSQRFMSVHIQVPGAWSVQDGHGLLEEIEQDLRRELEPISVLTHLEPVEDPRSWDDIPLDRKR